MNEFKSWLISKLLPAFILEMSKQMTEQSNRCTAHPFWQVRCKRYEVTAEGYNEHHWILVNDDGEFFRSDHDENANDALLEHYPEFCEKWQNDNDQDDFFENFDADYEDLPSGVTFLHVQEVEQVISTHLTEHDANWFIKRKQHDYPKLYTWVESAYWSPQFRQLQDWIISLTHETNAK